MASGNIKKISRPTPNFKIFSGKGLGITPVFHVSSGLTTFEMQYNGGSGFIVWLLKSDTNEKVSLLANKSSYFYGIVAENLEPDYYKLEIDTDNDWFIKASGNII